MQLQEAAQGQGAGHAVEPHRTCHAAQWELQPHRVGVQLTIHVLLCTCVTVVGVWVLLGSEMCYLYLYPGLTPAITHTGFSTHDNL